jgi:site-specific recombinase XerC
VIRDADKDAQHNYRRWFNEALTKAKFKDYSWHCKRHTFASRLVMAGVSLRTVAELMGRRSMQMTMRCARLAPQHTRAAVGRLATASMSKQLRELAGKVDRCEKEAVTKSVTSRKRAPDFEPEDLYKSNKINELQDVAP